MARNYLEEQGYDLQSYVDELLRNMKDDLFETVGIEYEDIDAAMEQVLSAAYQRVQKEGAGANVPVIPKQFEEYYKVASEEDIFNYGLEPLDGDDCEYYGVRFVGFAIAKEEYADALADNGLEVVCMALDGKNQYKLVQIVGHYVCDVSIREVLSCVANI